MSLAVPPARPPTTAAAGGRSWLRGAVHRRLAGLRSGRIRIADPRGATSFGQTSTDFPDEIEVRVKDLAFYRRVALGGSLGAAEAYIEGLWGSSDLVAMLRLVLRDRETWGDLEGGAGRLAAALAKPYHWLRANTRGGSRRNIHAHYDLGNDFFALFLDDTMTYSCGIFEDDGDDLRAASLAKLDRICRKLRLREGMRLLDIGGGWGALAIHAAGRYGVAVTMTTISEEQFAEATRRVESAGLGKLVEVVKQDYRDLRGRYDRVVSIEMIEAVGHSFLPEYFRCVGDRLEPHGLAAIQAITIPDQMYESHRRDVDFIKRYIFPGSCLPSVHRMLECVRRETDLRLTHLEDITPHYPRTLRAWRERFLDRLDDVRALGYPEEFIRMWEFYLAYCEAGFAERYIGDVQLVLSKPGCEEAPLLPPLHRSGDDGEVR